MSYGSDWTCKCGWANLDARRKCRNCGEPNPSPEPGDWEARALAAEAERDALREALKPFAEESLFAGPQHEFVTVKLSDCDRARRALTMENNDG